MKILYILGTIVSIIISIILILAFTCVVAHVDITNISIHNLELNTDSYYGWDYVWRIILTLFLLISDISLISYLYCKCYE